jgi:hypothetical protein
MRNLIVKESHKAEKHPRRPTVTKVRVKSFGVFINRSRLSGLGQKQTSEQIRATSALAPKADIQWGVCLTQSDELQAACRDQE